MSIYVVRRAMKCLRPLPLWPNPPLFFAIGESRHACDRIAMVLNVLYELTQHLIRPGACDGRSLFVINAEYCA